MNIEKLHRTLSGRVVSNKTDKSLTVLIERKIKHPLYGKIMKRSKRYHVHDETNQYNEGDTILIEECRPVSKTKTWVAIKLISKSNTV